MPSTRRRSGRSTLPICCTGRFSCSVQRTRCTRGRISAPTSSTRRGPPGPRAWSTRSHTSFSFFRRSSCCCGERQRGLVFVHHQRDLRADAVAADPVAVQGHRAPHLRAADVPGRVGDDQERVCLAHRHRARAQGKDRDMTTEILVGLVMLIVMIGAIFIGIQISFTLLFLALAFGYFALGKVVFDLAYFQTIGMMKEELLAAVPLFIFMGYITEQAGLMERLVSAFRMVLAPGRGSPYIVGVVASAAVSMATGIRRA